MARVIRSRLLLILAITSLAISAPAVALADCLGGGGEGGGGNWQFEFEWGSPPSGGGTGGGSIGGGTSTTPAKNPIIFIHGINSTASIWQLMKERFSSEPGWTFANQPLYFWQYDWVYSNAYSATLLSSAVNEVLAKHPGTTRVDFIAHSMGGLVGRYYIKNFSGAIKVDDFAMLGTPNHGTEKVPGSTPGAICYVLTDSCKEMTYYSSWLNSLNSGDETPGTVNYGTWRSECDGWVVPSISTFIVGAVSRLTPWCMSHSDLYKDLTVYQQVREFVK